MKIEYYDMEMTLGVTGILFVSASFLVFFQKKKKKANWSQLNALKVSRNLKKALKTVLESKLDPFLFLLWKKTYINDAV